MVVGEARCGEQRKHIDALKWAVNMLHPKAAT
jgi:hypothetical protein